MTWVHDRIFAAGGEEIPKTWDSFADQTGVTAVLHLCPFRPIDFRFQPPRVFLWMALADEAEAGVEERLLASRFIDDCLAEGQSVLLHSSLGRHKARWAYVAFCIWSGQTVRAALRRASRAPWLSPYHTDRALWERFAEAVRTQRMGSA